MSTRAQKTTLDNVSVPLGYEGQNIPTDFVVPSCTIEDVDVSLFNLFHKQLPFEYMRTKSDEAGSSTYTSKATRVPVIFATGERFALLSRKEPLRAKDNIMIIPLISVRRTAVDASSGMGAGTNQSTPTHIKTRLSPEDPRYQRLINKLGLKNSDDIAAASSFASPNGTDPRTFAAPGRLATRRSQPTPSLDAAAGRLLTERLGTNLYEVITLPPPKYFLATYEVTFWAQYTQQMNDMLMAFMSMEQDYHQRSFKLESDKGYWFVAYTGESLSDGGNASDFSEDERLVRYSFEMKVPAYIVNPEYPGSPPALRSYVSAPQISFEIASVGNVELSQQPVQGVPSGRPIDYILSDHAVPDDGLPGRGVANTSLAAVDNTALPVSVRNDYTEDIAGSESGISSLVTMRVDVDPLTGRQSSTTLHVKTRNVRKGETVYKTIL